MRIPRDPPQEHAAVATAIDDAELSPPLGRGNCRSVPEAGVTTFIRHPHDTQIVGLIAIWSAGGRHPSGPVAVRLTVTCGSIGREVFDGRRAGTVRRR
jgi:hypothetical protein